MHGRILPRRACNSCGFTMKMSSRYNRLLIYDVKRTTKIDGMGPFKLFICFCVYLSFCAWQPIHFFLFSSCIHHPVLSLSLSKCLCHRFLNYKVISLYQPAMPLPLSPTNISNPSLYFHSIPIFNPFTPFLLSLS